MDSRPKIPDRQEIYRKIQLSLDLLAFAYSVKEHQLALKFPHLSKEELKKMTWELIERGNR